MFKPYCRCGEQLEVIDSDGSMPRTFACPKCAKEYALSLTEIVKRSTYSTNKFYTFYHQYNNAIGIYLPPNGKEAYATSYLFVEAIDDCEAEDIVRELVYHSCDVMWDGGELVTSDITQYVEDYVHEFHYGYSACIIFRNGDVTCHANERMPEEWL